VTALLAAVALVVASAASAKSYDLTQANVAVRIANDGSLLVREDITFSFSGAFSGAYRDIPLRAGESIDHVLVSENGQAFRPGGNTKLGSSDTPGKYGVERDSGKVRVVWHYQALDEQRTFSITYRFRGLAVAYDDVVDVNMKVWGDEWRTSLGRLSAVMILPGPATGPRYRVYGHPRWVKGITAKFPTKATLQAVDVPAHQFVEMRVVFPRRLLTSTAGAKVVHGNGLATIVHEEVADEQSYLDNQAQIDDAKHHWLRTAGYLLLIGLVPALVVIGLVWLVFGRERRTDYDREYEQQPPTDTQPALVPPLLRQSMEPGSLEFTATLFDLIRRGYYTSKPVTTEHDSWGGLKKEQVSDLELSLGDQSIELEPNENSVAAVFNSVLASGPERLSNMRDRIKADRTENAKRFESFKDRVGTAIKAKRWYVGQGAVAIWIAIVGFVVAGAILIAIPGTRWRSQAPRFADIVLLAIGICMIVDAAALFFAFLHAKTWRRRTKSGETEAERWQAFRHYLTDFPRLQDTPPATLQLWERFLVYGIAFGIAERVLQGAQLRMPKELHDQSSVYWITPYGDLGSGASAFAIGDLSAGFGSALAPPSSSGSGGGFSGGGGGGGGGGRGGAW
jgi:uncharacterized membrane protein